MPPVRPKPAKPYRRGETLGKASRAAQLPRPAKPAPSGERQPENSTKGKEKAVDTEEDVEDDEVEDMEVKVKRVRGKKGKKFVESQDALLSLVAAITSETESKRKAKLVKGKKPDKGKEERVKLVKAEQKRRTLDVAKALVIRARSETKAAPNKEEVPDGGRKRVSFA